MSQPPCPSQGQGPLENQTLLPSLHPPYLCLFPRRGDSPQPKATALSPHVPPGLALVIPSPAQGLLPPGADPTLGDPGAYLPLVAVLLVALPESPAAATPQDGVRGLGRQRCAGVAQSGEILLYCSTI